MAGTLRLEVSLPPREAPALSCGPGLLLRGHSDSDLAGILGMCQDPETQRWTTIPIPYGPRGVAGFLAQVREGWSTGAMAAFALQFDGHFAGNIDLRLEEGSWAEGGYVTAAWARRQSVMTRALRAALECGFTALDLSRESTGGRSSANDASKRVAEK